METMAAFDRGRDGRASRVTVEAAAACRYRVFVPGVHAKASVTSASLNGETTCSYSFSFTQPGWPNDHGSRCAFFSPQWGEEGSDAGDRPVPDDVRRAAEQRNAV